MYKGMRRNLAASWFVVLLGCLFIYSAMTVPQTAAIDLAIDTRDVTQAVIDAISA